VAHRVLVTDKLAEEGLALLRAEPGLELVVAPKLAGDPRGCVRPWPRPTGSSSARGPN
jgi:hypothetical protein